MFRKKNGYDLPENVVSFLRGYNKMYVVDSQEEAVDEFEKMVKELVDGRIEEYITPTKRIQNCLSNRGILIQLFCKDHTFGVFSYYWEDKEIFKLKRKRFITMYVNSNQLMKSKVAKNVEIDGKTLELCKDMHLFQEFYYAF